MCVGLPAAMDVNLKMWKYLPHHSRQRSTVRRLTPTSSVSCRIRAAVAPSRMMAISTTIAAT